MPAPPYSLRVAIAGASSLLGKELKELLEESRLAPEEIRLLDEELSAGTLTEAGGEPVVIQAIDEESFADVRFAFFTGTPAFAAQHGETARRSRATVIDLSGGLAPDGAAALWIPVLDPLLPPPAAPRTAAASFISPPAPAIVACLLAAALTPLGAKGLSIVFLQPVSERGQWGVEELESQTVKLLSFQPIAQEVFDAQVAFNLLDRFGGASQERLADARARIARDVRNYVAGRVVVPAIQLLQAPVFYSHAFSAYAEFASPPSPEALSRSLDAAGLRVAAPHDLQPSNVIVAGESCALVGAMERDPNVERGFWLWGAADNLRLAAANAIQIAEKLLVSAAAN